MYYFVSAYWERGGRRDGSVNLLMSDIGPSADPNDEAAIWSSDPAFWFDWLDAVKVAEERGMPDNL